MTKAIIEVERITKKFGRKTVIRDANFKITRGEIFGLIGQNGAGKSTLLKMIGGLMYPTSGNIHYFDRTASDHASCYERMGLLIEHPGLYPQYTAYDNLKLIAISYGLKQHKQYITELLQLVGLEVSNKTKVKHYSMGMKQRLGIAIALLGSPDVLILDEPINGLDPQGIVEMRELILELNKKGLTIVISSHILEELSKVATQYAIIHKGEIIEVISQDELLLRCEERIEVVVDDISEALPVLEQELNIIQFKVIGAHTVHIYDTHIHIQQIVKHLAKHDQYVRSITNHKMSLEQYFLERTERAGESLD